MSQAETRRPPADVEGSYPGWRRALSNQPSQAETTLGDSSGPLFSIYSDAVEEEDNKLAERWRRDAQVILIFTGLFSIFVAVLITMSIQDLRPNSQDTSAFYLENIYQLMADRNISDPLTPITIAKPPAFSPPGYAIWVNSLWFLSMAISLSCALLATLLHQWAHRYIRVTQPLRSSPHKRARIREFFANGVDTLQVPWAVEAIPTLLHLSLFTFFAGLLVLLFNINSTTFCAILAWVAFSVGVYACITLIPIFRHDSPYYTPL
ncbi:hypothetical protein BC827DRAFT_1134006, partial [Russula dissimulans]